MEGAMRGAVTSEREALLLGNPTLYTLRTSMEHTSHHVHKHNLFCHLKSSSVEGPPIELQD